MALLIVGSSVGLAVRVVVRACKGGEFDIIGLVGIGQPTGRDAAVREVGELVNVEAVEAGGEALDVVLNDTQRRVDLPGKWNEKARRRAAGGDGPGLA